MSLRIIIEKPISDLNYEHEAFYDIYFERKGLCYVFKNADLTVERSQFWKQVGFVTGNHENNGITVKDCSTVIPLFL
jgi:hypothetical protein